MTNSILTHYSFHTILTCSHPKSNSAILHASVLILGYSLVMWNTPNTSIEWRNENTSPYSMDTTVAQAAPAGFQLAAGRRAIEKVNNDLQIIMLRMRFSVSEVSLTPIRIYSSHSHSASSIHC